MTIDSVEESGEAEAEHCIQKEHSPNHLLLQRSHEVHIWSEHGQDSQKEKQHKPKQMGPNDASFCVDAEDILEASLKGGRGWSMAM